jgi:hypothetical protein
MCVQQEQDPDLRRGKFITTFERKPEQNKEVQGWPCPASKNLPRHSRALQVSGGLWYGDCMPARLGKGRPLQHRLLTRG